MAKAKSLSYKQVLNSLNKKEYFPIYLLHGEESFYIDELTKHIEENVLEDTEKAFNQTILYGKEIDYKTVLDSARRYPVMSEKQVVIIKEAQELKTLDKLESYFQNLIWMFEDYEKADKAKLDPDDLDEEYLSDSEKRLAMLKDWEEGFRKEDVVKFFGEISIESILIIAEKEIWNYSWDRRNLEKLQELFDEKILENIGLKHIENKMLNLHLYSQQI